MSALLQTSPIASQAVPGTRGYRMPVWQVATLGVLAAWLYWSILGHLAAQWLSDPNFSHGFIVPAFAIWVAWTKRFQLADAPIEPTWVGLWIVIPALLMLIVGVL